MTVVPCENPIQSLIPFLLHDVRVLIRLLQGYAVYGTSVAVLASFPALGQTPSEVGEPAIEEIVVMGSLIKQLVVFEDRAPVQHHEG